jgi:hypothetical protein
VLSSRYQHKCRTGSQAWIATRHGIGAKSLIGRGHHDRLSPMFRGGPEWEDEAVYRVNVFIFLTPSWAALTPMMRRG